MHGGRRFQLWRECCIGFDMNQPNLLIVFIKNPEKGKVKTRLAKTIGDEKALQVYMSLLRITFDAIRNVNCNKAIFSTGFGQNSVQIGDHGYLKFVQWGNGLGEKMSNAFQTGFIANYKKVLVIGSDCPEISNAIIVDAFRLLDENEVVIGPAADGGYYLIGMKKTHPGLFTNKNWSTDSVLAETIADLKKTGLTYKLLPVLSDVDEEDDLKKFPWLNQS